MSLHYDFKSDVWMFGVLLWEIFVGTKPWSNMQSWEISHAVCKEKRVLEPPLTVPPRIRRIMAEAFQFESFQARSCMLSWKPICFDLAPSPRRFTEAQHG